MGIGALASGFDFLRDNLFAGCSGPVVFGKKGIVLGCILAPDHKFFVQVSEFYAENCRLQCVESAIHAGNFVLVTPGAPMVCNHADFLGEVFVRGEERAAISVAAERLARVKTGDGNVSESACHLVSPGPECLGAVLDNPELVFRCDFAQFLEGGALTEEIYCNNALGVRSNQFFDAFGVDLQGFSVNIGKLGNATEKGNAFCGGDKGKVGDNYLVTRL